MTLRYVCYADRTWACRKHKTFCIINTTWLWPATDHEPHCRHVPINKIWRRTESTPRSGWWRNHMAGIYSDCSTREINNKYIGWSDVTKSVAMIRPPFCGYNMAQCEELMGEDLSCYLNKNSIGWFMKMSVWSLSCQQRVFKRYHSGKHF